MDERDFQSVKDEAESARWDFRKLEQAIHNALLSSGSWEEFKNQMLEHFGDIS